MRPRVHDLTMSAPRRIGAFVIALAMALAGAHVSPERVGAAGRFDGAAPMICAAQVVAECVMDGQCQRRHPERVNFPGLFRVDVKAMTMHNLEAEKGRQSAIRNVDHSNGKMLLSGADSERGWIVLINETTGRMSAATTGDGEGFVIFGQCALP
jgi:hypothetical protein